MYCLTTDVQLHFGKVNKCVAIQDRTRDLHFGIVVEGLRREREREGEGGMEREGGGGRGREGGGGKNMEEERDGEGGRGRRRGKEREGEGGWEGEREEYGGGEGWGVEVKAMV